jgi:hypothetical protein
MLSHSDLLLMPAGGSHPTVKRWRLWACCSTSSTIAIAEAFLGYPAATQAGTLMSRFETILNLIAACVPITP